MTMGVSSKQQRGVVAGVTSSLCVLFVVTITAGQATAQAQPASTSKSGNNINSSNNNTISSSSNNLAPAPTNKNNLPSLGDVYLSNDVAADARPAAQGGANVMTTTPSRVQCDVSSHRGCRVEGYERCYAPGRCACLNGYVRTMDTTGQCVAAQFYQGKITFMDTFSPQLLDLTSQDYVTFVDSLRQLVFAALMNQEAKGILDVYVTSVTRDATSKVVTSEWELAVMSSSNPTREALMRAYNQGLVDIAYVDDRDDMIKLADGTFVLGANGTSFARFLQPLLEFSHCVDKNHNYCDVNADCSHSLGSFTCSCRQGFDDVSPDVTRAPGERCAETCNCRNNGTCKRTSAGSTDCSCPTWYLGSKCEINGKDVLIITCSVVGGLIVVGVLLCIVCLCCCKRTRKSSRDSTVGVGSLDTSVVKLPRVWMDGSRPYELPPRDTRRWSYVSEPVRYVDEYIMDDYVHAGTLPLPRSHDAKKKYYSAYPNHGYSSSTLSARPYPRH